MVNVRSVALYYITLEKVLLNMYPNSFPNVWGGGVLKKNLLA